MTQADSRTRTGSLPDRVQVEDISLVLITRTAGQPMLDLLDQLASSTRLPQRILLTGLDPDSEQFAQVQQHLSRTAPTLAQVPLIGRAPLPLEPTGRSARPGEGSAGDVPTAHVLPWRALEDARAALPTHPSHWIWVLHEDSLPDPGALDALVGAVRRNSRVGVVGPKLVQAQDPRLLLAVGQHLTVAGRPTDPRQAALVDQGQLDQRQDVLGVQLAGALLRSDVIEEAGGLDQDFGGDGVGGLDLCWRCHLTGYRVVVAPDAVVRQGPAGLGVIDPLTTRVRQRQLALARGSVWLSPLRALGVLISSLVAALVLLLVKRPAEAAFEWADTRAVLSPARGLRARWRFRGRRSVRPSDLHTLFATRTAGWRATLDTVGDALDPRERQPARPAPVATHAESGPVSDEFAELGAPVRRSWWSWPLALSLAVATLATALLWRHLVSGLRPSSMGVSGAELRPVATDSAGLWHSLVDGWRGGGLGHQVPAESWLVPLGAATRFAELLGAGSASAGVTLAWLLALATPASALTAYLALRRSSRRRWLRAGLALGWAGAAPLTLAVSEGRVGPVVVHVLAPVLVAGYVVCADPEGGARRTAAVFATVLGVVLAAWWVPALLVASTIGGLVLLFLGRGSARWRGGVLALLPWPLLGPGLGALAVAPIRVAGGAGGTVGSVVLPGQTPGWQLALLNPSGPVDPASWGAVQLWLVLPLWVGALVAVLLRGRAGRRAGVLIGVALGALALALASGWMSWGRLDADAGTGRIEVTTWPGTLLSLTGAALLLGTALLLDQLLPTTEEPSDQPERSGQEPARTVASRRVGAVAAVLATAVVVGAGVVGLAWPLVDRDRALALQVAEHELPAVAAEQSRGPAAVRTLVLDASGSADGTEPSSETDSELGAEPGVEAVPVEITARLVGPEVEPGQVLRDRSRELTGTYASAQDLTRIEAAAAAVSGQGRPAAVVGRLTDLGVGYVLVHEEAEHPIVTQVDRVPGLTRVSSPPGQVLWRVSDQQASRARVLDADRQLLQTVPVDGAHGTMAARLTGLPEGAQLVLSEGSGWSRHAQVRVDGEQVVVGEGNRVALPAGDAQVVVSQRTPSIPWLLLTAGLLLITAFLALPFGRSETAPSRTEEIVARPATEDAEQGEATR